jgi:hypothetical protein
VLARLQQRKRRWTNPPLRTRRWQGIAQPNPIAGLEPGASGLTLDLEHLSPHLQALRLGHGGVAVYRAHQQLEDIRRLTLLLAIDPGRQLSATGGRQQAEGKTGQKPQTGRGKTLHDLKLAGSARRFLDS